LGVHVEVGRSGAYDANRRRRGRNQPMKKILIVLILAAIGVAVVKKVRSEA
jgi:hypothetical protein